MKKYGIKRISAWILFFAMFFNTGDYRATFAEDQGQNPSVIVEDVPVPAALQESAAPVKEAPAKAEPEKAAPAKDASPKAEPEKTAEQSEAPKAAETEKPAEQSETPKAAEPEKPAEKSEEPKAAEP